MASFEQPLQVASYVCSPGTPSCCCRKQSPCLTVQPQLEPPLSLCFLIKQDLEDKKEKWHTAGCQGRPTGLRHTSLMFLGIEESLNIPVSFYSLPYASLPCWVNPYCLGKTRVVEKGTGRARLWVSVWADHKTLCSPLSPVCPFHEVLHSYLFCHLQAASRS